jgi:hypothetical protein
MASAPFDSTHMNALVQTYLGNEANSNQSVVPDLVDGLLHGNAQSIRDFVDILGPTLTSTEPSQRVKGSFFFPLLSLTL